MKHPFSNRKGGVELSENDTLQHCSDIMLCGSSIEKLYLYPSTPHSFYTLTQGSEFYGCPKQTIKIFMRSFGNYC